MILKRVAAVLFVCTLALCGAMLVRAIVMNDREVVAKSVTAADLNEASRRLQQAAAKLHLLSLACDWKPCRCCTCKDCRCCPAKKPECCGAPVDLIPPPPMVEATKEQPECKCRSK